MKKEIIIKNQSFDVFTKDDAPEIQTKIDLIMLSYNGLKSTREFLNHYLIHQMNGKIKLELFGLTMDQKMELFLI